MKKASIIIIAALVIMSFSSCYVEVRGERRYHHPFWHHREVVVVGENTIKAKPLNNNTPAPESIYAVKK